MSTYAIGDIQGCHLTLLRLLEQIDFDTSRDRLWLVGDLVNRGPRSLDVLRWATRQDASITVVLGNHDVYLLARVLAGASKRSRDTLDRVIQAPDRDELIAWLRARPLLHRGLRSPSDVVLVHAGLHPRWTVTEAADRAHEAETFLAGPEAASFFASSAYLRPSPWSPALTGAERIGSIVAIFTRLRTCTSEGTPDFDFTGPPASARAGFQPWFRVPGRGSRDATVVFGHWASLGLHLEPGIAALDTGCVYRNVLTALRLEDGVLFQQAYVDGA